jgi:hypothetical protein
MTSALAETAAPLPLWKQRYWDAIYSGRNHEDALEEAAFPRYEDDE